MMLLILRHGPTFSYQFKCLVALILYRYKAYENTESLVFDVEDLFDVESLYFFSSFKCVVLEFDDNDSY